MNVEDNVKATSEPPQKASTGGWARLLIGAVFVAAAAIVYFSFRESLTLDNLAAQEASLRELQESNPLLIYSGAFLLYVVVTGLSLPGAAVLSLVFAWYFGFARALVLVSFASTTGATVAFLMSRFVLRDMIQSRFGERLAAFNKALDEEGAFYLFTLRLIPAVPFFVINAVMGLTSLPVRTFWWVSQVGMLPGTVAYTWAGSSVPDLATLKEKGASGILSFELLAAFAVLGVLPLALKKTVQWLGKRRVAYADDAKSTES